MVDTYSRLISSFLLIALIAVVIKVLNNNIPISLLVDLWWPLENTVKLVVAQRLTPLVKQIQALLQRDLLTRVGLGLSAGKVCLLLKQGIPQLSLLVFDDLSDPLYIRLHHLFIFLLERLLDELLYRLSVDYGVDLWSHHSVLILELLEKLMIFGGSRGVEILITLAWSVSATYHRQSRLVNYTGLLLQGGWGIVFVLWVSTRQLGGSGLYQVVDSYNRAVIEAPSLRENVVFIALLLLVSGDVAENWLRGLNHLIICHNIEMRWVIEDFSTAFKVRDLGLPSLMLIYLLMLLSFNVNGR